MLLAFYYPFSDERVLNPGRAQLVPSRFLKLGDSHRFYRNLGTLIERPRDGFPGWIGESTIGSIRKSIRVDLQSDAILRDAPIRVVFKRFFFDGAHSGYFSVGISLHTGFFESLIDYREFEPFLRRLLGAPISSAHRPKRDYSLEAYGKLAVDLYGAGSRRKLRDLAGVPYTDGISLGRPLIIVSAAIGQTEPGREDARLEPFAEAFRKVRSRTVGSQITFSSHLDAKGKNVLFGAFSTGDSRSDDARFLRSGIARLYLQLFSLERAIAILQSPAFDKLDEEGLNILGMSVNDSLRRLEGAERPKLAIDQQNYDDLIQSFATSYRQGYITDLTNIIERLQARPNLSRALKTSRVAVASAAAGGIFIGEVTMIGTQENTNVSGGVNVSGGTVNTGGGNISGRDTVVVQNVREQVNQSFAPVEQAISTAPADKQEAARKQLEELKAEASKGKDANDGVMAKLVEGLIGLVPTAVTGVVSAFASPILGGIAGPVTKYVLDKIQGK